MLDFAIKIGKKAGDYILDNLGATLDIHHKGRIDLVTQVDNGSQKIIIEEIEKNFPDHSILSEEGVAKNKGSLYQWIIDPLDGTVNYIHCLPIFCVSIALYKSGEPYIGVCYNPVNNELFWAQTGKGSYLGEKKIHVSDTKALIDSLLVTGFPYVSDDIDKIIKRFSRVIKEVQGIRRLGSAALDLCYVAAGIFDGFWEIGLNPWDIAAGAVILLESGGKITSVDGSLFDLNSGNILASNQRIHNELIKLM